ncbi:aprataxin and PNK-like factor isoform X2 [Leguminivora glycinivorella]|uniref:aprataxin and PNK-like factor isoform X2 n=1 Tax=Leguminivora glycinivorella TaxID=1035111 RepID=UPI0020106F58|nr:aprataxin and PNK-like factor isoform X2 [Leguminivora glycinivorella]
MVFKLVRIDAEEPNKIQLPLGTHLIGRGKFLDCEDKRISRNHGHLIISGNSVVIEALHQNPCFYTKKGSEEKQVLKKSCKEILDNGDRFGLLPGSYWYEVLHCTTDTDSQATDVSNTEELNPGEGNTRNSQIDQTLNAENGTTNVNNTRDSQIDQTLNAENVNTNVNEENKNEDGDNEDSLLNFELNETVENAGRSESPSLLDQQNSSAPLSPITTEPTDPPEPTAPTDVSEPTTATDPPDPTAPTDPSEPTDAIKTEVQTEQESRESPPKRSHSPEGDDGVKRIKTEPNDVKEELLVKQEPDAGDGAGPSSGHADQASASNAADGKAPPSPAPAPPRERCLYGADCYRRNPVHKAQFAHPRDPDWGSGEQAPCPYGAACRKRDPRHWRLHSHPPQARMPAPAGAHVVERHGNVFYINAHAVNFYDDHFQVEDDDGDSVDFDYEF